MDTYGYLRFSLPRIRLPYQEYLVLGIDPRPITCAVPKDQLLKFSYVAKHVSDDTVIGILERFIQSVKKVREDQVITSDWEMNLMWLNNFLDEVWSNLGPNP